MIAYQKQRTYARCINPFGPGYLLTRFGVQRCVLLSLSRDLTVFASSLICHSSDDRIHNWKWLIRLRLCIRYISLIDTAATATSSMPSCTGPSLTSETTRQTASRPVKMRLAALVLNLGTPPIWPTIARTRSFSCRNFSISFTKSCTSSVFRPSGSATRKPSSPFNTSKHAPRRCGNSVLPLLLMTGSSIRSFVPNSYIAATCATCSLGAQKAR